MVELQEQWAGLASEGIWVGAISYDSVEVLAAFAERFGIGYPLLADTDSAVISRFGILNELIPPEHPWHGVPFPGTFIADGQGRVVAKSFYADHGVRDSLPRLVQQGFGSGEVGPFRRVTAGPVTATAALSAATIRPGQVQSFDLRLIIDRGYHVQGRDLPTGYVPIQLEFAEVEGVQFGPIDYPVGRALRFEKLNETLQVYSGEVGLKVAVVCRRKADFVIRARLQYQACDHSQCQLPAELEFEFEVAVVDNIWD